MDLGELGENILSTWASQVDLVANKSGNDKDGWDFIVGFPQIINKKLKSLDFDDSHNQCLIQVKATKSKGGNRSIKLSNLKRLVDSNLPAFYLSIEISDDGAPIKAYIFHVWEEIIERLYKRFRKLDKDSWGSINTKRMNLPIGAATELVKMHGSSLKSALNQFLGESSKKYLEEKIKLKQNVGYTEGRGEIKFGGKVPKKYGKNLDEFYVDFTLGLIDKVDLNEFSVFDIRFGNHVEMEKNKGGYASVNRKPNGKAILKMISSSLERSCEISTDFYLPTGTIIKTDHKYFKVLYRAPYLDIIITPNQNKFHYKINLPNPSRKHQLSEYRQVIDFTTLLNEVKTGERIFVEATHNEDIITKLEFEKEQELFDNTSSKTIMSLDLAINFLHHFKIRGEINATPNSLFNQYNMMNFVWKILSNNSMDVRTEFWVAKEIDGYKNIILVMPTNIIIGEKIIALQFSVHGTPKRTNQIDSEKVYYELQSSDVRIELFEILNKKFSNAKESHKKMADLINGKYDKQDTMVVHLDEKQKLI